MAVLREIGLNPVVAMSSARAFIAKELIDQSITGPMSGDAANAASIGAQEAADRTRADVEFSDYIGYRSGVTKPDMVANRRSGRTVLTVSGVKAI